MFPQLIKKSPTFYGTRTFITAFTSACHLTLPEPNRSHVHSRQSKEIFLGQIGTGVLSRRGRG